ncbi:MAG: calcium-binding protein [Alphaproteobacteria bacterium]|jgi:Ca2+-binding RTX toxin-like protein
MADGHYKPIEEVRTGDLVMAFDPRADQGRGALQPQPVVQTFQNLTQNIINLRGLYVTPGHVCLTDHGRFESIAAILLRDGILVNVDGTPMRARTGACIGSMEDTAIKTRFFDPALGVFQDIEVRAGIPIAAISDVAAVKGMSFAAHLSAIGISLSPHGALLAADGSVLEAAPWPAGSTPFDSASQQDWILRDPQGTPYRSDFLQGLENLADIHAEAAPEAKRYLARKPVSVAPQADAVDFMSGPCALHAFSEQTKDHFEYGERLDFNFAGATALAPERKEGWCIYNFEVKNVHTYVVNGLRVHNNSGRMSIEVTLTASYDSFPEEQGLGSVKGIGVTDEEGRTPDQPSQPPTDAQPFGGNLGPPGPGNPDGGGGESGTGPTGPGTGTPGEESEGRARPYSTSVTPTMSNTTSQNIGVAVNAITALRDSALAAANTTARSAPSALGRVAAAAPSVFGPAIGAVVGFATHRATNPEASVGQSIGRSAFSTAVGIGFGILGVTVTAFALGTFGVVGVGAAVTATMVGALAGWGASELAQDAYDQDRGQSWGAPATPETGFRPIFITLNNQSSETALPRIISMDLDADGDLEALFMPDHRQGVLVWDTNGDGIVNNGLEMSFARFAGGWAANATDMDGLRVQFDVDGDGVLRASTGELSALSLWVDANANGISDAGELQSLAAFGITALGVSGQRQDTGLSDMAMLHRITDVTFAAGHVGTAVDLTLRYWDSNSDFQVRGGGTALAMFSEGMLVAVFALNTNGSYLSLEHFNPELPPSGVIPPSLPVIFGMGDVGNDTIVASFVDSFIDAYDGNDLVIGGGGNDDILAGDGADTVEGNAGEDIIYGEYGNDSLSGGAGNDTLDGEAGADTLVGGLGADSLNAGSGADLVSYAGASGAVTVSLSAGTASGAAGNDSLSGIENVLGGVGADSLLGDVGANQISGGDGADTLNGGLGNDSLVGENGTDLVSYADASGAVTVSLAAGTVSGAAGNDILSGIENVLGGAGADSLLGDAGANQISGGDGADTVSGGDGADTLDGGLGADSLVGENGTDLVSYAGASGAVTVSLAAGTVSGAAGDDILSGIENVLGGFGADSLLGDAAANWLSGQMGSDSLYGYGGMDILSGGIGNDQLEGGQDGDVYTFGRGDGADTIYDDYRYSWTRPVQSRSFFGKRHLRWVTTIEQGDGGSDTLEFQSGVSASDLMIGVSANDLVVGVSNPATPGLSFSQLTDRIVLRDWMNSMNRIETFRFADGTSFDVRNTQFSTLGLGNDSFQGSSGADWVIGDGGNDSLMGGAGSDVLNGGAGDDSLVGGDGSDDISGGDGNDSLVGGLGSDDYRLSRGGGTDRVDNAATDHLAATDRLVLGADVARNQVWLQRSGEDLLVSIIGTSDSSRVLGWYTAGTTSRLDSFVAGDGRVMTEARVEALVQAMATMTPPPAGQTTLTTEQQNLLNTAITAAWQ